ALRRDYRDRFLTFMNWRLTHPKHAKASSVKHISLLQHALRSMSACGFKSRLRCGEITGINS
ncbi:MAG: hypothetical protein WA040_16120, partial [Anaerolineae bacterium]